MAAPWLEQTRGVGLRAVGPLGFPAVESLRSFETASLHPVPQLLGDNRKLGNIPHQPSLPWVFFHLDLASFRITQHGGFVVVLGPDVGLPFEDLHDLCPAPGTKALGPSLIQVPGDFLGAPATGIHLEDLTDQGGLFFVNNPCLFQLSLGICYGFAVRIHHGFQSVAKASVLNDLALSKGILHAALDLFLELADEPFLHHALVGEHDAVVGNGGVEPVGGPDKSLFGLVDLAAQLEDFLQVAGGPADLIEEQDA